MGIDNEGGREALQTSLGQEAKAFFNQQKDGEAVMKVAGFDEMMDAYAEAAQQGRFSDPIEFSMQRGDETIPREAQPLRSYLEAALRKYDHFGGENNLIKDPEQRAGYQERAKQVREIIEKINQLGL